VNREILLNAKGHQAKSILDPLFSSAWPRKTEGPFRELAKALGRKGFQLVTPFNCQGKPTAEIHINAQKVGKIPAFLLRLESGFVDPENDNRKLLSRYRKVFTWDCNLAQREGYVLIKHPQDFPAMDDNQPPTYQQRARSFCMIASNKAMRRGSLNDLYLERQRIIRWFESNAPDHFDLFGRKWDLPMASYTTRGILRRGLAKLGLNRSSLQVYRGAIQDKEPILRETRFSFALENIHGLPGYLTEKLFDCLFAGSIPIYCGDPLVSRHIPDGAYIPFDLGQPVGPMYLKLRSMSSTEFSERQQVGRAFLRSALSVEFSSSTFAERVSDQIVKALAT
jgi:hypothetical protein